MRSGGHRTRRKSPFIAWGSRRRFILGGLLTVAAGIAVAALALRAGSERPPFDQAENAAKLEIPPRPVVEDAASASGDVAALRSECFDIAERLVQTLPNNPHALCLLGTVHHLFASEGEALRLWQRCLEINAQFADAHLALGHRAVNRSEFATAERHFREALRIDPAWDEVPLPLADALMHEDKLPEAVQVLEKFLARHPDSSEGWNRLGKAYDRLEDYENAGRCYTRALAIAPDFPDAHYGAGTAFQKLGDEAGSREHLDRFRELQSRLERKVREGRGYVSDKARLQLRAATTNLTAARVYALHSRLEQAETHWKRAAELDANNRESHESLADLYTRQGRLDEALARYETLCGLEPDNAAHWLRHGRLAYKSGRIDDAATSFRKAIELAPQHSEGYAFLAQVEAARNLPEALRLARQAVELSPIAPHHFILSDVLWRAGDESGSRAALEQALKLDPSEPRYREAYARLRLQP
jgi:tetratricopeptide (TPR) repeat protein